MIIILPIRFAPTSAAPPLRVLLWLVSTPPAQKGSSRS